VHCEELTPAKGCKPAGLWFAKFVLYRHELIAKCEMELHAEGSALGHELLQTIQEEIAPIGKHVLSSELI
jgi:hypothetical protein